VDEGSSLQPLGPRPHSKGMHETSLASSLPGASGARTVAPGRQNRRLKKALAWSAVLAVAGCGMALAADRWVTSSTRGLIYTEPAAVPARPVGIVFGALVVGDQLAPVLRERVEAGVALYRAGKVRKLLMTGDNGRQRYDEVTPMKDYAVSLGVPARDVVRDFAGFRTYDSCYRAREIFGVDGAILITQEFHLPRALFLAHRLGLDAVGFAARPGLTEALLRRQRLRE
jgi:vancomycin permeability regulator SanA